MMCIGSIDLAVEDAVDFLNAYELRTLLHYDLGVTVANFDTVAEADANSFTLNDCGRVAALGVEIGAHQIAGIFSIGNSNVLRHIPQYVTLQEFEVRDAHGQWELVVAVYEMLRYQYGFGAVLASALLHLKRPSLVPVLTEPSIRLYSDAALAMAAQHDWGVPLYWEAVRQDLISESANLTQIRNSLMATDDTLARSLPYLTDLRMLCILADQVGRSLDL